jgi:hypothetical protein
VRVAFDSYISSNYLLLLWYTLLVHGLRATHVRKKVHDVLVLPLARDYNGLTDDPWVVAFALLNPEVSGLSLHLGSPVAFGIQTLHDCPF